MNVREIQHMLNQERTLPFYISEVRNKLKCQFDTEDHLYAKLFHAYTMVELSKNPNVTFEEVKSVVDKSVEKLKANGLYFEPGMENESSNHKTENKGDRAKALFDHYQKEYSRKQFIELFVEELDMTKSGASTYYHKLKREAKK